MTQFYRMLASSFRRKNGHTGGKRSGLSLSLHGGLRNNWTGLCSATEINKARLNSASVRRVERQLIRRQTPLRVDDLRRRNLIQLSGAVRFGLSSACWTIVNDENAANNRQMITGWVLCAKVRCAFAKHGLVARLLYQLVQFFVVLHDFAITRTIVFVAHSDDWCIVAQARCKNTSREVSPVILRSII